MAYDKSTWRTYLPPEVDLDYAPVERSGVLVVDKPAGLSSMDVIRVVKKIGKIKKVGHAGTLDPMATGVLPVLINKATKFSDILMAGTKEYDGVIVFGQEYDTQDITGQPVGQRMEIGPEINLEKIQRAASTLTGEIDQLPPVFSAIKKNGKPLYKYARKQLSVEVQPRRVTVETFAILEQVGPGAYSFYVSCGKGVYVRTLAHDLGRLLGTGGALASLRRLRVGKFLLENSVRLETLRTPDDIEERLIDPEKFTS